MLDAQRLINRAEWDDETMTAIEALAAINTSVLALDDLSSMTRMRDDAANYTENDIPPIDLPGTGRNVPQHAQEAQQNRRDADALAVAAWDLRDRLSALVRRMCEHSGLPDAAEIVRYADS